MYNLHRDTTIIYQCHYNMISFTLTFHNRTGLNSEE